MDDRFGQKWDECQDKQCDKDDNLQNGVKSFTFA